MARFISSCECPLLLRPAVLRSSGRRGGSRLQIDAPVNVYVPAFPEMHRELSDLYTGVNWSLWSSAAGHAPVTFTYRRHAGSKRQAHRRALLRHVSPERWRSHVRLLLQSSVNTA
ncbi:hypothetical protein NOVOSPHI9U_310050 [Novosphingobium sp. 9U]|nr:hypothetical protein NOVOSPHI9U_310050 [Novosphingobium sp. 9U]